ncbi:hypothetical protein F4604DRAFT_761167 [Suillus subluteus]|nr:hypothetical protein F4604DRAFT_761167 [Suillus subluteus]
MWCSFERRGSVIKSLSDLSRSEARCASVSGARDCSCLRTTSYSATLLPVLRRLSWILAVYFTTLSKFCLFTVLHTWLHSYTSGPDNWYLPAESGAASLPTCPRSSPRLTLAQVWAAIGAGCPSRGSAQISICIQSNSLSRSHRSCCTIALTKYDKSRLHPVDSGSRVKMLPASQLSSLCLHGRVLRGL